MNNKNTEDYKSQQQQSLMYIKQKSISELHSIKILYILHLHFPWGIIVDICNKV